VETKNQKIETLIIDDDYDICYLISALLNERGIHSSFVHSLSEAKASLKAYNPSVIFLDNHLPDGLGIEFVEYIHETYPQAKVIIVTGHDIAMDINNVLSKGVIDIIKKPFTKERIYSTLDKVI